MVGDALRPLTPEEIHAFWFADTLGNPASAAQRMGFWFESSRETDALIAKRFTPALQDAGHGALKHWEAQPHARLALIIVLDQFPRSIHRGTAAAFRHDRHALEVTRRGVAAHHLRALTIPEQFFFLMPFQHTEDLGCQREGLKLFEQMVSDAAAEWRELAQGVLDSAVVHLNIIERFGRFPHRNAIRGRESTPAEIEYLEANAESFGQSAAS